MCIYTCIMQIRAENQNLVSALNITINKILCQFFEFTQNLKRSQVITYCLYKAETTRITLPLSLFLLLQLFFQFLFPYLLHISITISRCILRITIILLLPNNYLVILFKRDNIHLSKLIPINRQSSI